MRPDLLELIGYAKEKGLRAVISTNGTLITREKANELKTFGLSYVGISLDGLKETNDRFRGISGAFDGALAGIRNCMSVGIKVGLRFTINKRNAHDIPGIFQLIEEENIPRVCFYHLVYSGRGSNLIEEDLSHQETREVVDLIINKTREAHDRGRKIEVLTVDNHADGAYVYLRLLKENPERAKEVYELLQMNEGNSSGKGLACISWDGEVHADQFWRQYSFGNIRKRKFRPGGAVRVGAEAVGGNAGAVASVTALQASVSAQAFPALFLTVGAVDAAGNPVSDLPAAAFALDEDGAPLSFVLSASHAPPPSVLLLFDGSRSLPEAFLDAGIPALARRLADETLAADAAARFRLGGVNYGTAAVSPAWLTSGRDVETEAARVIAQVFGSVTNLLNLDACIIGGGLCLAGELLPRLVRESPVLARPVSWQPPQEAAKGC